MPKDSRFHFRSASWRGVALTTLLGASLVGAVGCAGGSNPFCGNSKNKCEVEALERAQNVDEEAEKASDSQYKDDAPEGRSASVWSTDGSGDAPTLANSMKNAPQKTFADDATSAAAPKQKMLETASTSAVAPEALRDATVSSPETPSDSGVEDALLAAPGLPTNGPSVPVENAPTNEPNAAQPVESAPAEVSAPPAAGSPADSSENAPQTSEPPTQDAAPSGEKEEAPEPTVAQTPRRDGSQRVAARRVAQRGSTQAVVVPQTRGVASRPAVPSQPARTDVFEGSAVPSGVVKMRVRAVVL